MKNDDQFPTFLVPVELPEYCFLSEVVEWMAVGRVPQAEFHMDGSLEDPIDYRFYWKGMPDNFEQSYEHLWFNRLEFQSTGIPIEEDYFLAAERCFSESVSDLPNMIAEYEAKEPSLMNDDEGEEFNFWQKIADEHREKLGQLSHLQKLVDRVEAQFERFYELAWAKLFQQLHNGALLPEAINMPRWESLADNNEYERAAKFEQIDGKKFGLNFDYMQNEIEIDGVKFVALRLRTAEILQNRNILLQAGDATSVMRFGAFYSTENTRATNLRRKRGRPNSIDWDVLKKYLNILVQEGRIPDGKESCIYELIAFSERKLGKSPSRSSVQRHLTNELNHIYA